MDVRPAAAFLILCLLGAGLWWVVGQAPPPAGPGTYPVVVVGPDQGILANGTVTVTHATALAALLALGRQEGFDVGHEEMAGFGACSRHYVRSIAGVAESTTGGWNYYTRQPGRPWTWQPTGAGCPLPRGVEVEWCWVEGDVCRAHAP